MGRRAQRMGWATAAARDTELAGGATETAHQANSPLGEPKPRGEIDSHASEVKRAGRLAETHTETPETRRRLIGIAFWDKSSSCEIL